MNANKNVTEIVSQKNLNKNTIKKVKILISKINAVISKRNAYIK